MFTQEYEYEGFTFSFFFDGSKDGSGVILSHNHALTDTTIKALKHAHKVFCARFEYADAFHYENSEGVLQALSDPRTEYTSEFKARVLHIIAAREATS